MKKTEQKQRQKALAKFEKTVRAAFDNAYDDDQSDAAVKLYFYPFSGLFFTTAEWDTFILKDEITVRKEKVKWVVREGGKRLAKWRKTLNLGDDKYLTVIVYGMVVDGEGNIGVDWVYHVGEDELQINYTLALPNP